MYGRPLRRSLDLLRVSPQQVQDTEDQAESNLPRAFEPKAVVYTKVYAHNKWAWEPGTVMEKVCKVMYNIWLNSKIMIRSHINQLWARTPSGPDIEQTNKPSEQLPINILLNEWKLPHPSSPVLAPTSQPPESTVGQPVTSTASTSQSSTSSSTTESVINSSPVVQLPRRSSRNRRSPQWFQAYRRC
ncbi:uncharacterized protein LOC128745510 [Sabethes cyaneus]|uniref:uncharacterized protein LOC128745510 n=1 Tax=Sabethes cyaneus TaxID=53552 RepID=UPI00237E19ED|nr:uncharacterized protein LOC128745510 [Sabethes cyaneus]